MKGSQVRVAALVAGGVLTGIVVLAVRTPDASKRRPFESAALRADPARSTPVSSQAEAEGEWPNLFGPTHDGVSTEPNVSTEWPKSGPPLVWQRQFGERYSSPAISAGRLVFFHRTGDEEIVECLDAASAKTIWKHGYPTSYEDRYGYNNGPRCTPIIHAGRVYTLGAEGTLTAIDLATGSVSWQRQLNRDYQVEQGFFGVGATPLLENDRLIINVGGKERGAGIVAVNVETGKTIWKATDHGASYATPRAATIAGQRLVFVFTEAGLVSLDPASGKVHWSIPFRSKVYESVNATSPVVVGDLVFVSASYGTGSLAVRVLPEGGYEELWRDRRAMESHFSNVVCVGGYVYGFSGRHENGSDLRCVALETGEVKWRFPTVLGRGSMVRVGDRLIVWGERGHLVSLAIDPAEPKVVAFTDQGLLHWPCWTPPAIAAGRLYLCNEHELICLDLRAASPKN